MASSARKIVIEFLGDSRSAIKAARATDDSTSKLGKTFAGVGKAAAVGLGAGIVAAGYAMVGMTKNAIEDEAAQRKLATALKNSVNATDGQIASVEDYIAKTSIAKGVTDDELRPAFQRLVESTGSITEAQKQMDIALDASAGTGKDLNTVTTAMMKANNGTTASLSRLGLKTKDAHGNTLSLKDAMASMAKTFHGQAEARANSLEGKMARLQIIFDETKEAIGARLIPILEKFADWFLTKGQPQLQRFGSYLQLNLLPVIRSLGEFVLQHVVPALLAMGKAVLDTVGFLNRHKTAVQVLAVAITALVVVTKLHAATMAIAAAGGMLQYLKATKLISTATKIYTAFQWLLNAALTANPIGIVVVALAALGVALVVAYKKSETFRNVVDRVFGFLKKVVAATIGWIKSNWKLLPLILLGPLGIAAIAVIKGWSRIKAATSAAWGAIKAVLSSVWSGIKSIISGGVSSVVDFIRGLPSRIRALGGNFKSAGQFLIQAFVNGMKNAAGIIGGIAGNVWDVLQGLLNSAIDKINAGVEFGIHRGPVDIDINPPDIPHLARGTRNFRGGMALVGEQGPELVIMPRGAQVKTASQTKALAGGGGGEYVGVVNFVLDGKIIQQSLLSLKRRNGQTSLGLA